MELAPQLQPRPAPLLARWRTMAVAAVLVVAVAVGAWSQLRAPVTDPELSHATQQARMAAFAQAGAVHLPLVPLPERAAVLAGLSLPAGQAQELNAQVDRDETRLVWLTLWDDQAEDGDVVAVEGAGVGRVVQLTNAPQRLAVPIGPSGVLTLRGVYDGGGGITVAVATDAGAVPLPVIAVGQTLMLQVAP